MTTDNIAAFREPVRRPSAQPGANPPPSVGRYTYRLGPGDRLEITFFADPAGVTDTTQFTPKASAVVDETGRFFYPFLGSVRAEGRTVGQVRSELTTRLEEFFASPQVEVAVEEFNAHDVIVGGAVLTPGRQSLTNIPMRLVDAVNVAGLAADADSSRIEIRRGGSRFEVNLLSFLANGSPHDNPVLLPDDFVFVPVASENKVFTFGEIQVGEIQLTLARKTLLEVLAEAGGIDRVRADARGIFVFRRDDAARRGFDVYQFNLTDAAALVLAAEFGMAPLDIVFVTNDPATRWNDTLSKIIDPFESLINARSTGEVLAN
ncbi:MAG: polysaccharide biosynthesis/export family protein [Pseudomonadota bacterium]